MGYNPNKQRGPTERERMLTRKFCTENRDTCQYIKKCDKKRNGRKDPPLEKFYINGLVESTDTWFEKEQKLSNIEYMCMYALMNNIKNGPESMPSEEKMKANARYQNCTKDIKDHFAKRLIQEAMRDMGY